MKLISQLKELIKELTHRHKFTTLLIYPPRKNSDNYDFLLRCDCGYTKLSGLPHGIKEIFEVKPESNKPLEPPSKTTGE